MKKFKKITSVVMAIVIMWTCIPVQNLQAANMTAQGDDVSEESQELKSQIEESQEIKTEIEDYEKTEEMQRTEEKKETEETEEQKISYVMVENSNLNAPGTQHIMVDFGDENITLENATLSYQNQDSQEMFSTPMQKQEYGAILFSMNFNEEQSGSYVVTAIDYEMNGSSFHIDFVKADIEAKFGVNAQVETSPDAFLVEEDENTENISSDVVTIDENGDVISQNTIQDALSEVDGMEDELLKSVKANGNVVVVLDPGHDNTHAGARANGLKEEQLNLKIALYCKAELEQYAGVQVYLTRTENGNCPYPGTNSTDCNAARVAYAKSVGAKVFVSLHLNTSPNTSAAGTEIYYPNQNYNATVGIEAGKLADHILTKMSALGLNSRGKQLRNSEDNTKYPDGSLADYYGVIRKSKLEGIPAIIVEHAFMSNQGDVNTYLNSDAGLKKLGIADAEGIAEYFGLKPKNTLNLKGMFYLEKKDRIEAGIEYQTTAAFVAFRWMAYDVSQGTWSLISDWSAKDYISWKPNIGNYWLRVDARSSDGIQRESTIEYKSNQDYTHNYMNIKGIFYSETTDYISAAVDYETNDAATKFRWMSYDVQKGIWTVISDWGTKTSVNWKPGVGNYWLRVDAETSDGIQKEYAIVYNNKKDFTHNYVNINGIYHVESLDCISAAVSYETSDPTTMFRWMSYDVNKGTWTVLSDWSKKESINWKPTIGNYWLRVDAKASDGIQKEYAIVYNNQRDYTHNYLNIDGIYYKENTNQIDAGAVHQTNDSATQFRWLVYDVNKGTWTIISDWKTSEWVAWNPESGDYWLRVEGRTSDGVTANSTLTYHIERFKIAGNSNISLNQMINYYNANETYPSYYQSTDAPNIQTFCEMYLEECAAEGIKAEVAFCQAMKETGFLRFKGEVKISQFNFAGIGATNEEGAVSASFPNVRTGIRAQVQHLKAYASKEALKNPCVDPRFHLVTRGIAPYVEWLGIQENPQGAGWASDKNYGYSIKNDYIYKLLRY
ncbi:MAG: N-acetylmuramoyl-L-alanine amidase [Lachnospiraceae bacterium]